MTNVDLGFWLAVGGFEVRPAMIVSSIEEAARGFSGLLVRVIGKRLPARWMLLHKPADDVLGIASRSISKMVKKRAFTNALPATKISAGDGIRHLHWTDVSTSRAPALWTPAVWRCLVEFVPFLMPGKQNELVKAARAHSAAPAEMQRTAARAMLLVRLYVGVFTEYDNPEFIAGLTPCIAGLLLHFKDNPGTEELLQQCASEKASASRRWLLVQQRGMAKNF